MPTTDARNSTPSMNRSLHAHPLLQQRSSHRPVGQA
jgi:hypothetical protein